MRGASNRTTPARKTWGILVLGLILSAGLAWAVAVSGWVQDFETDAAGWLDTDDGWYAYIDRVPSGTNGIASSGGDYHAEITNGGVSGPFSRFAGYADEWPGTWMAEIDVYLDPAWPAGTGFDYSVAASGSDGNHQRDYIFHVTSDTSTGDLLVAGSNNTNFAPREDLENINHFVVDTAGWYTLRHVFYDLTGALAVDLQLVHPSGVVLFNETRFNAADTIPGEVGGNRYAWFTFVSDAIALAVDNHELLRVPQSKNDCKKGGWRTLVRADGTTFKNQGQCIRYVNTGK